MVHISSLKTQVYMLISSSAARRDTHKSSNKTLQEVLDCPVHDIWTTRSDSEIQCRIIYPISTTATQSLHYNAFHAVSNLISPQARMLFGSHHETSVVSPRLHHDEQNLSKLHSVMFRHACMHAQQSILSWSGPAWVRSPPTPTHKTCLLSAVGDLK